MLSALLAPSKKTKQDDNLELETGVGTGVQNPWDDDEEEDDSSNIEDVDDDDLSVASNASVWSFVVNSTGKSALKLVVDTKETETSGTLDLPLEKANSVEATGTQNNVTAADNVDDSESVKEASIVNDDSSNIAVEEEDAVEDESVAASSIKKEKSRKSKKKCKSRCKSKDKDKAKRSKMKCSSSRSNSPYHRDNGDNVESVDGQYVISKSSKRSRKNEQVEPKRQSNVLMTGTERNEETDDSSLLIACCDDDVSITSIITTDEALMSNDDDNALDSDDDDQSIGSMKLSEQESLLHISKQLAMISVNKTKLSGIEKPLFGIDNDDDDDGHEEKKSEASDGEVSRVIDDNEMHSEDDTSDGEVSVASAWSLFATPQTARGKKKLSGALQTFLTESSLAAQKEKRLQEKASGSKSNPNIETSTDACAIQAQQPSSSKPILGTMNSNSATASKDKETPKRKDSTSSALKIDGKNRWSTKLDDFLTERNFTVVLDGDGDNDDVQSTFTDVSAIRRGKRISVATSRRKMSLKHQSSRRSGSFHSERSLSLFSRCPPKTSSGKSSRSLLPPQAEESKEIGTLACSRNAIDPTSVKHTRSLSADVGLTKFSLDDGDPEVNHSKQERASTMPSLSSNKTKGNLNDFFSNPSRCHRENDVHSVCTSLTAAKSRRSRKGGNFSINVLPDFDFPAAINNHKRSCSTGNENSKPNTVTEIPSKKLERSATTGANNSKSAGSRQKHTNSPNSTTSGKSSSNKPTSSLSSNHHHSRQKSGGSNTKSKRRSDAARRISHHSRNYASLSASQPIGYCHSTGSLDHYDSMKHSAETAFHESISNSRPPSVPVDSDVKLFLKNAFSNDHSKSNGSMTFNDLFDQSKQKEDVLSPNPGSTRDQQSQRQQSCDSTNADNSSKREESPISVQRKSQSSPSATKNRNSSHNHYSIDDYSTEVLDCDLILTNKSKGSGHCNCEFALDVHSSSLSPQNDSTPQVAVYIKDNCQSPRRQLCDNTSKEKIPAKRMNSDKVSTLYYSTTNNAVATSGRRGRRQAVSSIDSKSQPYISRNQSSSSARKSTQRGRRDIPKRHKSCSDEIQQCGRHHRGCNRNVSFKQACSEDLHQQLRRSLPNMSINPQVLGKQRQSCSSRGFKDESSMKSQQRDTRFCEHSRRSRSAGTVYQSFGVGNSMRHNNESDQLKGSRQMDKSRNHSRNHLRLERNTSNRIQNREKELYPCYLDKIQRKAEDSRPRRPIRTYSKDNMKCSKSLNSSGLGGLLHANEKNEVATRRPVRAVSKNKTISSKSLSGDLVRFLQVDEKSGRRHPRVGRRGITRMQSTVN